MKTVILHNLIVWPYILLSVFSLRQIKSRIVKAIVITVAVCAAAVMLFLDAIALGIIGPVPN